MMGLWNDRSGREKSLIGTALALLTLFVLWQFVYKPISKYPAVQERAYKQAVLDLKIMQKGQSALQRQSLGGNNKPITMLLVGQLQSTVTKNAKARGIQISRRQPKGNDEITMWLENADSKAFYEWVDELTMQYNILLLRAQLNRNDGSSVRAQVTFKLMSK